MPWLIVIISMPPVKGLSTYPWIANLLLFLVIMMDASFQEAIKQKHLAYLWVHMHSNTDTSLKDTMWISFQQTLHYTVIWVAGLWQSYTITVPTRRYIALMSVSWMLQAFYILLPSMGSKCDNMCLNGLGFTYRWVLLPRNHFPWTKLQNIFTCSKQITNFNRRYFGDKIFDILLITAVSYIHDFKSKFFIRSLCG